LFFCLVAAIAAHKHHGLKSWLTAVAVRKPEIRAVCLLMINIRCLIKQRILWFRPITLMSRLVLPLIIHWRRGQKDPCQRHENFLFLGLQLEDVRCNHFIFLLLFLLFTLRMTWTLIVNSRMNAHIVLKNEVLVR
jgi:hypothetical protein